MVEKAEGKRKLLKIDVDGRIILKLILEEWDVYMNWIRLARIETSDGLF
jgi:hypothetical protein